MYLISIVQSNSDMIIHGTETVENVLSYSICLHNERYFMYYGIIQNISFVFLLTSDLKMKEKEKGL